MHFHAQFKSPSHIVFCYHLHKHKLHNWNVMSQANKSYSGTISAINECINNSHTHTVIARSIFDNNVWHNYGEFHHKTGDLFDMCQNRLNFLLFVRIARTHTFSFSINSIHLKLIFVTPTHTQKKLIIDSLNQCHKQYHIKTHPFSDQQHTIMLKLKWIPLSWQITTYPPHIPSTKPVLIGTNRTFNTTIILNRSNSCGIYNTHLTS